MAGSLQIAARPPPNPTNTLTNASATGGGVGGGDSAAIAVAITAEAAHKWTDDGSGRRIDSGRNDRGQRGPQNP